MSKKEGCKRITRHTAEGVSPTAASTSQSRPCEQKIKSSEFENTTASGNYYRRTWFQRVRPMEKAPPSSRRRRSKPMSMTRSNAMSATSVPRTAYLVAWLASKLVMMQACASGDHLERSYGCRVSQAGPKQWRLKFTRIVAMITMSLGLQEILL